MSHHDGFTTDHFHLTKCDDHDGDDDEEGKDFFIKNPKMLSKIDAVGYTDNDVE